FGCLEDRDDAAHTKDLALKFFIITKRDLVIPPVSELLEYDMVLISHGRFGVENDKGGFEFKGECSLEEFARVNFN
ncbi:hypothetical protein BC936DRAFT_140882, partial [Jimgerdemannia flammicorona]